MRNRTILRHYIEHFLRYSASINYKNITFTMMAIGTVELFNRNSNKLLEVVIKQQLSNLFALEGSIINLCLNNPMFSSNLRAAVEILRAFSLGYMQIIKAKPQTYTPYFAQTVTVNSCTDFMSIEDLTTIDNVIRLFSYGLILKLFIDAIPPLMPEATNLDTAILRSLMISQKEAS